MSDSGDHYDQYAVNEDPECNAQRKIHLMDCDDRYIIGILKEKDTVLSILDFYKTRQYMTKRQKMVLVNYIVKEGLEYES